MGSVQSEDVLTVCTESSLSLSDVHTQKQEVPLLIQSVSKHTPACTRQMNFIQSVCSSDCPEFTHQDKVYGVLTHRLE